MYPRADIVSYELTIKSQLIDNYLAATVITASPFKSLLSM